MPRRKARPRDSALVQLHVCALRVTAAFQMAIILIHQEATDASAINTMIAVASCHACLTLMRSRSRWFSSSNEIPSMPAISFSFALPPVCLPAYVRGQWLLAPFGQAAFGVHCMAQRGTEALRLAEFGLVGGVWFAVQNHAHHPMSLSHLFEVMHFAIHPTGCRGVRRTRGD